MKPQQMKQSEGHSGRQCLSSAPLRAPRQGWWELWRQKERWGLLCRRSPADSGAGGGCTGALQEVPLILVLERRPGCFSGFDENLDVQGELILQDAFQVWDPKSLIRKGRERHLFLFEISLVFSKEIKDSSGHTKYVYKNKLLVGGAGGVRRDSPFA